VSTVSNLIFISDRQYKSKMLFRAVFSGLAAATLAASHSHEHEPQHQHGQAVLSEDSSPITLGDREQWMRVAVQALHDLVSPCPFSAFGAAIVNHTSSSHGDLICIGANTIADDGNPTLHGEIAAINNCTAVLRDPNGPYKLSPEETSEAWKQLSLYTTAEACPMCASAIRWAGFKEYIYATSTETLIEAGWPQMSINSRELFRRSGMLEPSTDIITDVLHRETDALFDWQFDSRAPCPAGCSRSAAGDMCAPK
jgi:tRNA(Arg) A34 adenosine deaminase TadA